MKNKGPLKVPKYHIDHSLVSNIFLETFDWTGIPPQEENSVFLPVAHQVGMLRRLAGFDPSDDSHDLDIGFTEPDGHFGKAGGPLKLPKAALISGFTGSTAAAVKEKLLILGGSIFNDNNILIGFAAPVNFRPTDDFDTFILTGQPWRSPDGVTLVFDKNAFIGGDTLILSDDQGGDNGSIIIAEDGMSASANDSNNAIDSAILVELSKSYNKFGFRLYAFPNINTPGNFSEGEITAVYETLPGLMSGVDFQFCGVIDDSGDVPTFLATAYLAHIRTFFGI